MGTEFSLTVDRCDATTAGDLMSAVRAFEVGCSSRHPSGLFVFATAVVLQLAFTAWSLTVSLIYREASAHLDHSTYGVGWITAVHDLVDMPSLTLLPSG